MKECEMRGEAEIRMDAHLWSLVAELEALIVERKGMEAFNEVNGGPGYEQESFLDVARRLEFVAKRLREEV